MTGTVVVDPGMFLLKEERGGGGGGGNPIFFETFFAANYFIPHTTVFPIPPRSYTR